MKKNYFFYIILLFLTMQLTAQSVCQEQLSINNGVNGFSIGQSIFMSGCSGFFNSIEFDRSDVGTEIMAELNIFSGQTFLGPPLYTQDVTIPDTAGPFTIDFNGGTGDLSFFEDSQYTFILTSSDIHLEASTIIDSYSDGQMFLDVGFVNNDDLWFKLYTTTTLEIESHELKKPSLFPNPANSYFQISGINNQEAYAIYDTLGTQVKSGIVFIDENIDIQNLPIGLYYLKLNDGNTFKFVKK